MIDKELRNNPLYKRVQKQKKKALAVNIPKTFEDINDLTWKLKSGIEQQYLRDDKKPLNQKLEDMSLFFGLFSQIQTSLTVMKREIRRLDKN
ncbi:hypothetical protein [Serratia sp. (in: enterobacteria)]|uniref:hypothetical protein n=1 Tax=Serratia sp. (in: enterobacteria) TaxID=616 RepID=UPI00398913EE